MKNCKSLNMFFSFSKLWKFHTLGFFYACLYVTFCILCDRLENLPSAILLRQLDCSGVVMSSSRETHPPVSSQGYVIFLSLEMSGWCVALHPRQDTGLTFILYVHHLLCLIKGSSYNISIPLILYSYTIDILQLQTGWFPNSMVVAIRNTG